MKGTTMIESRASCQLSREMAMKLTMKSKRMRAAGDDLYRIEAADGVDVRRDTLHQFARLGGVVEREGQVLDVVQQIVAQALGDGLGTARGQRAADEAEAALRHRQQDEAASDQPQDGAAGGRGHVGIDEVADDQIRAGACNDGNRQAEGGDEVGQAMALHQAPQADQRLDGCSIPQVGNSGDGKRLGLLGHDGSPLLVEARRRGRGLLV